MHLKYESRQNNWCKNLNRSINWLNNDFKIIMILLHGSTLNLIQKFKAVSAKDLVFTQNKSQILRAMNNIIIQIHKKTTIKGN